VRPLTLVVVFFDMPAQGEHVVAEANHLAFTYDLTLDEARRRAAVLRAIGDDWDPAEVLAQEDRAYAMLYSDLDDDQQRIYDDLVGAGVLPDRLAGRVAD
jgi:Family of unknown function (DUF6400)